MDLMQNQVRGGVLVGGGVVVVVGGGAGAGLRLVRLRLIRLRWVIG